MFKEGGANIPSLMNDTGNQDLVFRHLVNDSIWSVGKGSPLWSQLVTDLPVDRCRKEN